LVGRTLIRRSLVRRLLLDGLLRLDLVRRLLLVGRVRRLVGNLWSSRTQILIRAGTLALARKRILALTRCRILARTASEDRSGALCLAVRLSLTSLGVAWGWRGADAARIEAYPEELPFAVMILLVPGAQRSYIAAACHAREAESLCSVARRKRRAG
jgi:hypothetical protein